jgi:hypothetical protein
VKTAAQRLVDIAKESLVGADEVSMTLVRGDKPFTAEYTGELALDADKAQYERRSGRASMPAFPALC